MDKQKEESKKSDEEKQILQIKNLLKSYKPEEMNVCNKVAMLFEERKIYKNRLLNIAKRSKVDLKPYNLLEDNEFEKSLRLVTKDEYEWCKKNFEKTREYLETIQNMKNNRWMEINESKFCLVDTSYLKHLQKKETEAKDLKKKNLFMVRKSNEFINIKSFE